MTLEYPVAAGVGFAEEHEPNGREKADDIVGHHCKNYETAWLLCEKS